MIYLLTSSQTQEITPDALVRLFAFAMTDAVTVIGANIIDKYTGLADPAGRPANLRQVGHTYCQLETAFASYSQSVGNPSYYAAMVYSSLNASSGDTVAVVSSSNTDVSRELSKMVIADGIKFTVIQDS